MPNEQWKCGRQENEIAAGRCSVRPAYNKTCVSTIANPISLHKVDGILRARNHLKNPRHPAQLALLQFDKAGFGQELTSIENMPFWRPIARRFLQQPSWGTLPDG
jgi:hypothetical protein